MATNRQIREAIVNALDGLRLNTYLYPEDAISVPAAVVSGFDIEQSAFGGNREVTARVLVVVSRSHVSQLELLDELLDGEGERSVVGALNDRPDTDGISLMVTDVGNYGEVGWGDVSYYGAQIRLTVMT